MQNTLQAVNNHKYSNILENIGESDITYNVNFNLFQKFGQSKQVLPNFTKISYEDSMINYGTDKPDLRNPLIIKDITKVMELDDVKFEIFKKLVSKGSRVRVI